MHNNVISFTYFSYTHFKVYDNGGDQNTKALNNVTKNVYVGSPDINIGAPRTGSFMAVRGDTAMRVRVLVKCEAHTVTIATIQTLIKFWT
jgi:hypothetical protein